MAKVSFVITPEALAAFSAAQEDKSVRSIVLAIENEQFIFKSQQSLSGAGSESDFNGIFLDAGLETTSAAFVLFREPAEDSEARQWVLVAWVPDMCRPKDKMLYSSSRESLKRGLGFSLFAADYYCNEKGDLSWDAYKRSVSDVSGDPLSEVEQLKKEEAALERDTNTKSSAMGDLPFEILPETTEALAAFAAGGSDRPGVLALSLENEKVGVYSSASIPSAAALASAEGKISDALPDSTKPAYVLCRLKLNLLFIYYCPEEAPVKAKMVYSTAKATVMGVAANSGIAFAGVEEVRSIDDLNALASPAAEGTAADASLSLQSGASLASRAAPPGKSRPRTMAKKKFVADE